MIIFGLFNLTTMAGVSCRTALGRMTGLRVIEGGAITIAMIMTMTIVDVRSETP